MWDLNAEEFLAEFEWAFENEIAAHVEAISTGEDFKIYIEKKLDFTSWSDLGLAMGCLHMGQLAEAKELLQIVIKDYEALTERSILDYQRTFDHPGHRNRPAWP